MDSATEREGLLLDWKSLFELAAIAVAMAFITRRDTHSCRFIRASARWEGAIERTHDFSEIDGHCLPSSLLIRRI